MSGHWKEVVVFAFIIVLVTAVGSVLTTWAIGPDREDCLNAGNIYLDGVKDYCAQTPADWKAP